MKRMERVKGRGTDSCLLSCAYVCRIHVKLPTTLKLKFSPTLKDSKQSEIGSNLVLLGCCRREESKCTSPIAILQLPKGQISCCISVGESQFTPLDPDEEQKFRSQCWVAIARPKRKGRVYATGDLAHTYKCEDDNFIQHMQGSSSRTQDAIEIKRLREELRQSKDEMHVF
ncbi:hypothetical protein D0Y65_029964, partial [Glycine soja]